MKNELNKFKERCLIVFSVNIKQKKNKSGEWKKDICFPKDWEKFGRVGGDIDHVVGIGTEGPCLLQTPQLIGAFPAGAQPYMARLPHVEPL